MPDMKRVGVLLVALAMTGCSGGGSTPPEASTTASSATPSVSKSVSPSEDPLYLEAVAVYRSFWAAERAVLLAGGASELPKEMYNLVIDPARTLVAKSYADLAETGVREAAEPTSILRLAPNEGVSRDGSVASMKVCEDSRAVPMLYEGKELSKGDLVNRVVYFKRVGSRLVISSIAGEVGERCEL
ncbi:MAG TPA: hypothetical protein H9987_01230 [Candidatus Luteococcus avicola]|nr:hypothetical protein [Candidatus Luteococcus avicola]